MKKLLVLGAVAIGLTIAGAAPAGAGEVCYDVNVAIGDQAPIVQGGCQDLPDLP